MHLRLMSCDCHVINPSSYNPLYTQREEMREVKQFHYTGWPDFGVPDYPHPVLAFIKRLARYHRSTEGPDVMHCSAGVGRTGTLVGIQAMIDMAREEEMLDVFNFVLGMRHQRNYMVQTEVCPSQPLTLARPDRGTP